MEVIIHRGQNQIGGNIVEIASASTRILLDVGLELDTEEIVLPAIDGLFRDAAFDAVFIPITTVIIWVWRIISIRRFLSILERVATGL